VLGEMLILTCVTYCNKMFGGMVEVIW
jgi:hypothetical protein